MEFLRKYPISHPFEAFFCSFSLIPPSLLFIVVRKSTLHPNCRALVSLWTCAQILMNVNMLTYCFYFTFVEFELYPVEQLEPPIRIFFTENAIRCWCICSCLELGISLERAISVRSPQVYHVTPRSIPYLAGYTVFAVTFGHIIAKLVTFGPNTIEAYIGTFLVNAVETSALVTNILVFIHSKRRYENNSIETTLNGRYQVQETYNISRVMLPVYLASFTFKLPILVMNWLFILDLVPYYVTDIVGMTFFAISTASMSLTFLLRHEALRHRAEFLFCRARFERRQEEVEVAFTTEHVTTTYFEQLDYMWK